MFDPGKTIELISGSFSRPRETWNAYLGENPTWQRAAMELTVPLVVAAVIIGWLLSLMLGGYFYYGYGRGAILGLIFALISAAISVTVLSFLVSFFAGRFGGRESFDRAFTGVSLAMVPGWAGVALGGIPFLGALLQLAGTIIGLVYLHKIIPLAVDVPEDKRALHFIVTLVVAIIVQMIIGLILGAGAMANRAGMGQFG